MSDGQRLLRSIIDTDDVASLFEIDTSMFYGNDIKVYNFIVSHYNKYHKFPGIEAIVQETAIRLPNISEPVDFYFEAFIRHHKATSLGEHARQVFQHLAKSKFDDIAFNLSEMQKLCRLSRNTEFDPSMHSAAVETLRHNDEKFYDFNPVSGITSGIDFIDNQTLGYQPTDLITWIAGTSVGKTWLLLYQFIKAAEDKKRVLLLSTEMPIRALTIRALSLIYSVDSKMLRSNSITPYTSSLIMDRINNDKLFLDNMMVIHVGYNKRTTCIREYIEKYSPDAVYLDGAYTFLPEDKYVSGYQKSEAVVSDIKGIASDYLVPIIQTTQFNKSVNSRAARTGKKWGDMEKTGFTNRLNTDSSIIVAVHSPPVGYSDNCRVLEFLKGREDERGSRIVQFDVKPGTMTDMGEVNFDKIKEGGGVIDSNNI